MASEKTIQKKVVQYAEQQGLTVIRMAMMRGSTAGWPDTIIVGPNETIAFVEFKQADKKPTDLQRHRIQTLSQYGFTSAIIHSVEDGKNLVDLLTAVAGTV